MFDATPLARGHATRGIGAATRCLIRALSDALPDDERPRLLTTTQQIPPAGFRHLAVAWPDWRIQRLPDLWPKLTIERKIRRAKPILFHATQHELIPDGRRVHTVATCYDLIPLHYPPRDSRHALVARRNLERLRTVALVCCSSRATADDVTAMLGIPPERIRVIPFAAPPHPPPHGETPEPPYLLYANSIEAHKNPRLAVDALAHAARDIELVVTGTSSPVLLEDLVAYASRVGVDQRIHWLGHVPAAHLAALRRDALAVLVTSRMEGFGLPVLESLAAGIPTLVANTPALVEVGAEAVTVLPHDDPSAWGSAIDHIANHPEARPAIAERGRAHAATFTWARTAELTVAAWRDALRGA